MVQWEYLTMTVTTSGEHGEDKAVTHVNGVEALVGVDYFGKQYPSFYERIYALGQEGWELAGIEGGCERGGLSYVFKRLIPSN